MAKRVKTRKEEEDAIQLEIMQYLKSRQHLFWRFDPTKYIPSIRQYVKHPYIPNGLPDIMVFHPGGHKEYKDPIFMGLEVKSAVGGRKGSNQIIMQRRWRIFNCDYVFVKSLDDVKDLGL